MKTALIRICLAVVFRPKTHFVIPASAAFLVFAVPHFFFHIAHPEGTTSGEAIALTAANGIVAFLGIAAILAALVRDRRLRITDKPTNGSTPHN